MLAAMNGHTAAVKLLLDMGSDINAQIETNRNTALTLACFQGRTEVVSLLVDRKANVEHRAKVNDCLGRHNWKRFRWTLLICISQNGWRGIGINIWNTNMWSFLILKGQYHHDQSRLSTGHGIGVLVFHWLKINPHERVGQDNRVWLPWLMNKYQYYAATGSLLIHQPELYVI